MDAKKLRGIGDRLLDKKGPLNSLWQETADNFYPERGMFTITRSLGDDFASNLLSSYPILCRRDLGNQFSSMLRPVAKPWFHVKRRHIDQEDTETMQWLQSMETAQRRAMYDPRAMFTKATKMGDHDYAAFGQCAISVELNRFSDGLLYRCWHLRDMAWQENEEGAIGFIVRVWKTTADALCRTFGKDKVHAEITKACEKEPFTEFRFMHIICEAEMYDDNAKGRPYWWLWYDMDHDCIVDARPAWTKHYVIPRWQTVSDVQYSYSPATVAALPDARLLQAMTWTLLEAGERATMPPMIATIDAVKSDIGNFAGGITWVDPEYDEKMGEALRPLTQDFRGFNFGLGLTQQSQQMIFKAFFLDRLNMPERNTEMTAYEVGQRVQQYIRDALPLFEPMEQDYNAPLCDMTFELLWRSGTFGPRQSWPKSLQQAVDIEFTFESPLHDAIDQQKGTLLLQGESMMASAMKLDPSVAAIIDSRKALRDALNGIGVPARWMRTESEIKEIDDEQARKAQAQEMLTAMNQAGDAAKKFSDAGVNLQGQPEAAAV